MTSSNTSLIVFVVVLALITYVASSGEPLIENFWGGLPMFLPITDTVKENVSVPQNNQAQLFVNPNPIINTSIMSASDRQLLEKSLSPVGSPAFKQYAATIQSPNAVRNPEETSEYYCSSSSNGPPVYTVPGNYQSYVSPRFNPNGLNSYVQYDLPAQQNLANIANDPLMAADLVHKRQIKEDYSQSKFKGETPHDYNKIYDELKKQGDEVANKLPVTAMNASIGNEQDTFFYNSDRFIFALQRNRLQGLGDPIRGDINCVPCNPSSDPSSPVWFRPSATPANSLRSGAINVIAGVGNVTSQQTAELQMRSIGGAKNTFGGVALPVPDRTPVANIQALQQAAVDRINMGNSIQLNANLTNPTAETVITTAFP